MDDMRDAIAAAGLTPPETIVADGAIHRFPSNGHAGDDAGWYVAFNDGLQAGAFGCWRSGECGTWRATPEQDLDATQRREQRQRIAEAKRRAEAERKQKQAEAATRAAEIWEAAEPAPGDYPYLVAKGVQPHGVRVHDGRLVIPMRDGGKLHSLQFIDGEGGKRFLPGGRTKGCYYSIGKPDGVLCIAEGFATAASIHEATGYAVAVAFNAGNLASVARTLRERMSDARIIIWGDNDDSRTGQDKAREAAEGVGGAAVVPPETGDFNDLAQAHGLEAVRRQIAEAVTTTTAMKVRRLSDVTPEPIRWLWPGRIARGKTTMIAGDPGLGKSQITASITAITTTGGRWPVDRTTVEPGNVVILSAEDDAADTIRPRLEAAGADVSRVYVIDAVVEGDRERHFNLSRDIQRLGELVGSIRDVRLVIIDPVSAYLGGTDSHKNSDIRELLAPLGSLAANHGAAFVLVSHLNKAGGQNALSRVTGSLAFVAASRAAYIVSRDPDDESRRLFIPAKNNIGPDSTGLAYHIESATVGGIETSRISWHPEAVEVTADEALAPADDDEGTERDDAEQWLRDALSDGPVPSKQLIKESRENGIAKRTLDRAKKELGIKSGKREGTWHWLPPEDCQPRGVTRGNVETRATSGFQGEDCQDCHPGRSGNVGNDGPGGGRHYIDETGAKAWESGPPPEPGTDDDEAAL